MVLNRSDYNVKEALTGGLDPSDPTGMLTQLVGIVVTFSVALFAWMLARNVGFPTVNNIVSSLTGGAADASQDGAIEVF